MSRLRPCIPLLATLIIWWLCSVSIQQTFAGNLLLIIEFSPDDRDEDDSIAVLEELENIDDDCDKHGIQFVKIDDAGANKEFGIVNVSILSSSLSR